LNARRIPQQDPQARTLLLAIEDVTERRELAEIRFQRLFETAKDGMVVIDGETETIVDVNPFFLELTGWAREDFIGKTASEAGTLLGLPQAGEVVAATRETEIVRYEDVALTTRAGHQICVDVVGNRYRVGSQPVIQLNIRDISARMKAVKALAESEARFRLFVDSTPDYAMFQLDESGTILSWNTGAQRLLGWQESEAVGQPSSVLFVPEDVQTGQPQKEIEEARTQGRAEDERWHQRRNGSRFFASGVLTPLLDETGNRLGFAKIMRDITERREQEDQLRRSLEEKNLLVREIHHRVKNNLQMIVSLLGLQAGHTNDPRVLAAFEETEGRVRAVARIHECLYASEDLTTVEFASYVTGLARELVALHVTVPEGVTLQIDVQDMALHIEQAIPLGLIANELILNSLKHGLRGGTGRLQVRLHYVPGSSGSSRGENLDEGWAELRIADDGPGLPPGLDLSQTPSLGFRLVKLLVRQLGARLEIGAGPGASFTVTFPLQASERVDEGREKE
jgi:PAS domain S-box-containing protein